MSKTLVFSFDGTGNEPSDATEFKKDSSISNVLKLHILMGGGFGSSDFTKTETPNGNSQVTGYFQGIGTRKNRALLWICRVYVRIACCINMAFAPESGDAKRILKEAYTHFNREYAPNDECKIVIFGFSRGAALARKFASTVLKKNPDCKIAFLGVFDTVVAMNGIHRRGEYIGCAPLFEKGTLHKNIERAVHLVSLDENRVSFEPTLMNVDRDNPNRILEVWFPGVHSDVGGGYWFDGLSDVALKFMIDECKKTLGDDIKIENGEDIKVIDGLLELQRAKLQKYCVDDIAINDAVGGSLHEHTGIMSKISDPRKVCVKEHDVECSNLPLIHQSVKRRFEEVSTYRPTALRGRRFLVLYNDGSKLEATGVSGLRNVKI